jgi:hypothetical protein
MWTLNKVILSDSFGESFSLCKNIELEAGVPVEVTLYPGDCHEEELLFAATSTTTSTTRKPKVTNSSNKSGEIIELGRHTVIGNDSSKAATEKSPSLTVSDTWKPIETTQSIIKNVNDTASSLNLTASDFLNTGERMPKAKTEKRSFGVTDDDEDSQRSIRDDSSSLEETIDEGIDDDMMQVNANEAEEKFLTVQLFPYRFGDIFERAEKYARNTLFPLLSEQISNIFSVETKAEKASSKNNAISIVSKSPSKKTTRKFEENNDLVMSASSYVSQNEEMTMNNNLNTVQTLQKLDKSHQFADNLRPPIEKLLNRRDDDIEKESVKIDLPTYKPPILENDKIFIPIDRSSLT